MSLPSINVGSITQSLAGIKKSFKSIKLPEKNASSTSEDIAIASLVNENDIVEVEASPFHGSTNVQDSSLSDPLLPILITPDRVTQSNNNNNSLITRRRHTLTSLFPLSTSALSPNREISPLPRRSSIAVVEPYFISIDTSTSSCTGINSTPATSTTSTFSTNTTSTSDYDRHHPVYPPSAPISPLFPSIHTMDYHTNTFNERILVPNKVNYNQDDIRNLQHETYNHNINNNNNNNDHNLYPHIDHSVINQENNNSLNHNVSISSSSLYPSAPPINELNTTTNTNMSRANISEYMYVDNHQSHLIDSNTYTLNTVPNTTATSTSNSTSMSRTSSQYDNHKLLESKTVSRKVSFTSVLLTETTTAYTDTDMDMNMISTAPPLIWNDNDNDDDDDDYSRVEENAYDATATATATSNVYTVNNIEDELFMNLNTTDSSVMHVNDSVSCTPSAPTQYLSAAEIRSRSNSYSTSTSRRKHSMKNLSKLNTSLTSTPNSSKRHSTPNITMTPTISDVNSNNSPLNNGISNKSPTNSTSQFLSFHHVCPLSKAYGRILLDDSCNICRNTGITYTCLKHNFNICDHCFQATSITKCRHHPCGLKRTYDQKVTQGICTVCHTKGVQFTCPKHKFDICEKCIST